MNTLSFVRTELLSTLSEHPNNALKIAVRQVEDALIEEALILTRGNKTQAAELLGINRATLRFRIDKGVKNHEKNT